MKKTVFICGLALLTAACTCNNDREYDYQPQDPYAYEQPEMAQPAPQQATITYRSYVQASYSRPVQQQVVYKPVPVMVQQPRPVMVQQPVAQQPACPCAQRRTCPCGC